MEAGYKSIFILQRIFIPRIPMIHNDLLFELKSFHCPVNVCFAMTINKSQDQILKITGVDVSKWGGGCFPMNKFMWVAFMTMIEIT